MYCHKCGKEIPDGAKYCNFCGAAMPEAAPRHARPDSGDEELYSFSDKSRLDPIDTGGMDPLDQTKIYENLDETRVYHFEEFEDPSPVPQGEALNRPDDREMIGDSYENYQDGEDDATFMDKLDNKFRRDEYDDDEYDDPRRKKSSKTWLWITLGVLAAILIIVFAILGFSGKLFGGSKKTLPTTKPTVAATVKPTEKPLPTQAPKPTKAPVPTKAPKPATEAPKPVTEAPQPITEAPKPPTEPPVAPTDPPAEPTDPPAEPTEIQDSTEQI